MKKTLYDILRLPSDATAEEIAHAYQETIEKLASSDQNDANLRVAVREAFQVLSHPQRRAVYDASLAASVAPPLASSTFAESETGHGFGGGWLKWVVGLVVIIGILIFWKGKRPAKPLPVAVTQTQVMIVDAPNQPVQNAPPVASALTPEALYADLSGSVARINTFNGQGNQISIGSGVVIGNGLVITNCHVTRGAAQIQVKIRAESYPATLTTADEEFDLCSLNVSGLNAKPVTIGTVKSVRAGQKVYAIGAPQGLDLTISEGMVSSLREIENGTLIQTTAPVSPGSSGGGLFDNTGKLVGIVTFQHRYGQNLNFAVPVDWIDSMRSRSVDAVANPGIAASEQQGRAAETDKILGTWVCFSPITGFNLELTFLKNRRVTGYADGKSLIGNYEYSGKALRLYGSGQVNGSIEEITDDKFIFNMGNGYRLACNRKT